MRHHDGANERQCHDLATLGALLDRRAAEHPDRDALAFPTATISYAELAARADMVARGLLALGVQAGETVGVLLPNCPDSIAVLFGAMKVGAVPVPVSTRFRDYELTEVISHSRMRILFTDTALLHTLTATTQAVLPPRQIVVLGAAESAPDVLSEAGFHAAADRIGSTSVRRRQELVQLHDTAMVLYTSGTSASPKGAMISHEAFGRAAASTVDSRLFLTGQDRVWNALPLFHVGGITFTIACIYAGCCCCHVGLFRPDTALDHLEAQRCTVALPGFETIWLPVLNQPDFVRRDLSALRLVLAVGVPERLRDMARRLPHVVQVSCFGMTESTGFLALNHPSDTFEQRMTTGGHPLPGMQCRVVDPQTGHDVAPGTEGELLLRGPNCFTGYLHDPEFTARCFDNDGWFHTGDVAVMDDDGRVTFVSRLKDMLKVGGENVSAAEVEGFLLRHPAVHIAAVVAAPDDYYVEVPAAYLELKPGAAATEQEIVDFCLGNIATYRVPRYVRFVDEWPMSGTKIKKYMLRERIREELREKGITRAPKLLPTQEIPG
ncbi:class I adenylate-forming enzyme family protein [Mycobacterium attenuatum]|uniref:Short-chain-fatty-acid--CoA ligase n=1 Tax=Mycobacterium attenuatum TaxID=2341086 RepID=A0A498Q7Q9_9MYCO|nr:class I adenylate-forming enzyme family protein [Mycobacterium attenuatum]VBA39830.1 Short-chain-fatty-acid--CoA ligase [Mycobacterium attenuatum]VBA58936.1 Short-chain-fatty-acid--CoA ligase [Mycobacterium attenuatum]